MTALKDKKICSFLRVACGQAGITVAELARRVSRSRTTCYLALENPSRYSLAHALIKKELNP